jgi:hypothetical protein
MQLDIDAGAGWRPIDLFAALDAAAEERAHEEAYTWIKTVRGLRVDDEPFRRRFTYRGDSLWWFAELYLHKEQAVLLAIRTIRAVDALIASARPQKLRVAGGRLAGVVSQTAAARGIPCAGPGWNPHRAVVLRLDARAISLAAAARLSRLRLAPVAPARASIAAFVHRAFWRAGGVDGGAEAYIGPVLRALESRAAVHYVGVGPRANFRARRWWDPLTTTGEDGIVPIERYAPGSAMRESRAVYRQRHEIRRRMEASAELRAHAVIDGVDCWPLVREQLAGIALLQFPWSARAMDEAAAALAALEPDVAVTYAEAGGWGRALALEARRVGVPLTGLQHGFIYRHWLNYRHEADEMRPDAGNADDRGFPLPAKTLVFDEHAAAHLRGAGSFPAQSIAVTGSPRLDELIAAVRQVTAPDAAEVRERTGAGERPLIVFAAKEREARASLPKLVAAVRALPELQLAIKPHPAETPEVYTAVVKGVPNIRVLDAGAPLPPLLGTANGIVTVNSTVAIDALALGVPSLVVGLPNNLSPFVDAGSMLGASSEAEIREALAKLLYDQEFRGRIARRRVDGAADSAAASADAILALRRPRS